MANMTPQTVRSRLDAKQSTREDASEVSQVARVAVAASAVTQQQLRRAPTQLDDQIASQPDRITGRLRTLAAALKQNRQRTRGSVGRNGTRRKRTAVTSQPRTGVAR